MSKQAKVSKDHIIINIGGVKVLDCMFEAYQVQALQGVAIFLATKGYIPMAKVTASMDNTTYSF